MWAESWLLVLVPSLVISLRSHIPKSRRWKMEDGTKWSDIWSLSEVRTHAVQPLFKLKEVRVLPQTNLKNRDQIWKYLHFMLPLEFKSAKFSLTRRQYAIRGHFLESDNEYLNFDQPQFYHWLYLKVDCWFLLVKMPVRVMTPRSRFRIMESQKLIIIDHDFL